MKTKPPSIVTLFHHTTRRILQVILVGLATVLALNISLAATLPTPQEGDFVIRDFQFKSREVLPELKLHYITIGTPVRDQAGIVRNAILLLHGTTGSGRGFLGPQYAEGLFGPGQPLDATRYFIILPDSIGHGKSSKPSDGLRARFPRYNYEDMVVAQYRLLTEQLGVNHLRLVMGQSMGASHTWLWGTKYADFTEAIVPLGTLPVQIAGQNRMWRRLLIDAVRNDPAWKNGDYTSPPPGMVSACQILFIMVRSRLVLQTQAPTTVAADQMLDKAVQGMVAQLDANDFLYQFESMRDYNPEPDLEKIQARVLAINFADDQESPPELGILEAAMKRIKRGQAVIVPASDKTLGHITFTVPGLWKQHLVELMAEVPQAEPDKIKAMLLRPAGWKADWSLPGGYDKGEGEWIFEARGDKVVAKIQRSGSSCEKDATITSDGVRFDGCYDRDIALRFDPNDQDYPFKGKSPRDYEYKMKAK
jgi:homoserine O-acetyltransferase/O-succinyltransferase